MESWLAENPETVETVKTVVWWVSVVVVVSYLSVVGWVVRCWWSGRSGRSGGRGGGDGWGPGARARFAVVRSAGGGRRRSGVEHRSGRVPAAFEFLGAVLRQAAGLSGSARVVRVLWVREDDRWVWGVSVDGELGPSVRRAVVSVWRDARVEEWPVFEGDGVSDSVSLGEGGGAVVRCYLTPERLFRPVGRPSVLPDHPMARVGDVMARYPGVDVQLRVDLVPLSAGERERVCADRLKTLGDNDPDRDVWEAGDGRAMVEGVRVLLRVSRSGVGHAAECTTVADRICRVLDSCWSTDYNRLTVRKVSDSLFDRIWDSGVVERDMPAWHWDSLHPLLAPPPAGIGKTADGGLPDPPDLETFDPRFPGGLMPIGVVTERGKKRMVGVRWEEATEPGVDLTVGATGSGKTYHAMCRIITLVEIGRGVLVVDPHRTAVDDIKPYVARHADRILEIDLQAVNSEGEPMSAGWNPLDLTVVPPRMRLARVDHLKGILPVALFPNYSGADSKAPQTTTIIRKSLECLLNLNHHLPPDIQATIFCIENLLLDEEWRNLAVGQLAPRDQKWWYQTYPVILGQRGASSAALKPALNALEQWKTQNSVQALLGASQSTLRWREIIDGDKILFVMLNGDGSESDSLLARLIVGEMITAFKQRGLSPKQSTVRPFHMFLDEFQAYAPVLEAEAQVIVQELRKFGAKVHFLNQSPSALSKKMREIIYANRTHVFCGQLGNPPDADSIAKAMGGQQSSRLGRENRAARGIQGQDLMDLDRWRFMCQVTQNGQLSSPFEVEGIDVKQAWAHLRTDQDITPQIEANTGLEPIEKRLHHYDTLPDRIAGWLQHQQPVTTEPTMAQQPHPTPPTAPPATFNGHSPEQAPPKPPANGTTQTGLFETWATDRLIDEPEAVTPTALLADSYTQHCQTKGLAPLPEKQFQQLLTHKYGPSQTARIDGKVTRVRRGIKLRPTPP